jgi:excisionase family DNA binding protein
MKKQKPAITNDVTSGLRSSQDAAAWRVPEAARRVECSRRFLEKQINTGRLRVVRLSPRCVRIRPSDLADYLERYAV